MSIVDRKFLEEQYFGWRAQDGLAKNYINVCKKAVSDESTFKNFKRSRAYKTILEHVSHDLGKKYLDHVKKNNPELLQHLDSFVKKNDRLGDPVKTLYSEYSNLEMSPTTARYIKVLSDLEILFGSLDGTNIVEIGGGYGGLATVISAKYSFNKYYNVDLKEPCLLSEKYCRQNNVEGFMAIPPKEIRAFFKKENFDLVISNYAFSECNTETQDIYIKEIFSRSKRGYITHNTHKDRAERVKEVIKQYDNFLVYGTDLSAKNHPILCWGSDRREKE